ncbi:YceI family protein [Sphingobacterium corticibacterium]|uniref:Polyisoprenoid-binding protein n=1 Tax=Sphingobacterium corticibacterium TaxID=2484746 RepID=A0A4Q6XQP0_9SPHI|nr:YceI family protein [Sphingobacterium corticibacterium]RZF62075.1 polyisoprenoid-binding protein [Sphingobacterium corticibacterium]
MKKLTLFFTFLFVSIGLFAQTTWTADPYHSKLGFTVTHLGIADVPGHFGSYDVSIVSAKEDFSDAVIELTVQTNSIDTRVEPRDNHLKSADFFDVEKYPTMTFKSTSIKKAGKDTFTLQGNLTLLGITKPVTMTMKHRGTTQNPNADGAPVAGIQITGQIKRSDFGLGAGFPAPMISDEVHIKADGEFGHKKD